MSNTRKEKEQELDEDIDVGLEEEIGKYFLGNALPWIVS